MKAMPPPGLRDMECLVEQHDRTFLLEMRNVDYRRHHNGYTNLAFPVLNGGEKLHWKAGSRVPEAIRT